MPMKKTLADIIKKYEGHPEFIGIHISDPNQPGAVNDTLLHIAARSGDLEGVEILIAAGAKINVIGDLGNTPLHAAAMRGQIASVRKLLKLGADPKIRNEFHQTASDVANLGGHQEVVDLLRDDEDKKR